MSPFVFINLGSGEIILLLILGLVPFILMITCLVDIVKSDFKDSATKLIWALIVLFAPLLGSLIYLAIGRKQKTVHY